MMGHSATVLFALAMMATAPDMEVPSMTHAAMAVGQSFEIATDQHIFRGQLLDRSTGACQMTMSRDGETFSPARTVYLLGATVGPQDRQTLILMHEVKVGLKMELGIDDLEKQNRVVTGEVKSIKFLR